MSKFLIRSLAYGLFWLIFFSMKVDEKKTVFKYIHEKNDEFIDLVDTWLGGRPAPRDLPP